jgi:hypothetical protein
VVVINDNSTAQSIDLAPGGFSASSVTPYVTDSTRNLAQLADVPLTGISLAARSVTTFVGTGTVGGATNTPSWTPSQSRSATVSPTASPTRTLTATRTPTVTRTRTSTRTTTASPGTATLTASATPTASRTSTASVVSPTHTPTPTVTWTNTPGSPTATRTLTNTSPPSTNFLTNADMEAGTAGWSSFGAGTLTADSALFHSGLLSLKITGRTAAWNGIGQNVAPSNFTSGQTYSVQVWVRSESGTPTAKATLKLTAGSTTYVNLASVQVNSNGWTLLSGSARVSWNGTLTAAYFYVETASGTDNFYIDDARLYQ